jgi:hypothetical protein
LVVGKLRLQGKFSSCLGFYGDTLAGAKKQVGDTVTAAMEAGMA